MAFDYEKARKAGYSDEEIATNLAEKHGIDVQKIPPTMAWDRIAAELVALDSKVVPASPAVDPYKGAERGDIRRNFIPLGAAMMAPVAGVRQLFGNEQAGAQALEAQDAIARNIPGGQGGMTAGKIGVTSLLAAPTSGVGAGVTGAAGVAARAAGAGATLAGARALDPMRPDQSRAWEAAKTGLVAAAISPAAEGVIGGASWLAGKGIDVAKSVASKFANGPQPSGAQVQQELILKLKAQGVDWAQLSDKIKEQLTKVASEPLTDNALVRAARVEQTIGVPATRGQAERSTEIMRNEQQFGGQSILDREAAQNDALQAKLSELATARGGSLDPMRQGESIRNATIAKQTQADDAISAAYKAADEEVGSVPVSADAFAEIISKNPLVPGVDTIAAKLKKAGVKFDDNGDIIAGQSIPASYMGEIRKVASAMTQSPERAAIGKSVKDAVDDTFAQSGIKQYAEAVSRARAGFAQFDNREIPAAILATRKGVESIKATSQLSDWVMAKSPEQLRELKVFFARGNEKKLREFYGDNAAKSGVQAVNDLKAAAIGAIINKGVRKSATAEGGTWTADPAAIVTAYRQFGGGQGPAAIARADEKMRAILGAGDFQKFKLLIQVAEDLSVPGRAQMKGSADANTNLAMRFLSAMAGSPAVGLEAVGMARGAASAGSGKKSAQWTAEQQANSMGKTVINARGPRIAAGKLGSLESLRVDK
jgi:hypothetical protein